MNELISSALRPLTVLAIIGAVAAFALVALPGGKPAAAAPLYPAYSVEMDNVGPTTLSLSHTEVIPNQNIIIQGSGFGQTPDNTLASAQIGDVDLILVSHDYNLANVEVFSSGQFAATFAIWPDNPADDNPTLDGGTLEIEITDQEGFTGTAQVTILTPTLTVTPGEVGPHELVVISGANWPVANLDGGVVSPVNINISGGGGIWTDIENAPTDGNGKWSVRYRVPGSVGIPSTISVQASYGISGGIVVIAKINVPAASLSIAPARVAPCARLTLNAAGFGLFENNITVKIGNKDVAIPIGTSTNRAGELEGLTVIVPGLDAGTYIVQLQVGGDGGTVATGEVTVLDDARGDAALSPSLSVAPDQVVPGGALTLNASGFPRCESNIDVTIGGRSVAVPTGTATDREGKLQGLTVSVPAFDAGLYIVQLLVGGDNGPVAFSSITVLADDAGIAAALSDALAPLGNNLVRVFHFNNATKTWTFYDPRPEFAELNTLSALAARDPYWVLVRRDQNVTLNGKAHTFICQGGDCWHILIW